MGHSIFIRSHEGDIPWLQHCLRSIQKFCSGFSAVRIVVPADQKASFACLGIQPEVCGIYRDDYMGQQATKLHADFYCGDGLITFVDSDCVFTKPTTPEDLLIDGKPQILMTPYAELTGIPWQASTEKAMKDAVLYEFMRRLPLTYHGSHIRRLRNWFDSMHGIELGQYALKQDRNFSEFNLIGAFCYKMFRDQYSWLDTATNDIPEIRVMQNWSWGGLTPEILARIEEIVK